MSKTLPEDWLWAYHKLRSLSVGRTSSAFLATLYHLRGDTGPFYCKGGLSKSRLVRKES
ncbi:hypothetical protein SAMN05216577_108160 [Pseudomonas citronellolis]|uniref:Uncharacterized protein n=1 Tax=Pseudomonas citronellolis TaxID=53408 RepID=A0AAQ1KF53_9PSED|nr:MULTISPECIES: hypothetical protein [Pseudomonas]MCL6693047.1 hypothetical protein [Pseudomonas sp. R3.Fl]MCP1604167.1 hypothetical protein [Pseudomonas citronellolis]MCP1645256.1 hypothetical protein [Pseudomonas citronellolis]MCP1658242.1 hypothetical protein [Pseudomonas citronellolis]MCP1668105.1 hypothetical protein [Pseudomonas citronellolis]